MGGGGGELAFPERLMFARTLYFPRTADSLVETLLADGGRKLPTKEPVRVGIQFGCNLRVHLSKV